MIGEHFGNLSVKRKLVVDSLGTGGYLDLAMEVSNYSAEGYFSGGVMRRPVVASDGVPVDFGFWGDELPSCISSSVCSRRAGFGSLLLGWFYTDGVRSSAGSLSEVSCSVCRRATRSFGVVKTRMDVLGAGGFCGLPVPEPDANFLPLHELGGDHRHPLVLPADGDRHAALSVNI